MLSLGRIGIAVDASWHCDPSLSALRMRLIGNAVRLQRRRCSAVSLRPIRVFFSSSCHFSAAPHFIAHLIFRNFTYNSKSFAILCNSQSFAIHNSQFSIHNWLRGGNSKFIIQNSQLGCALILRSSLFTHNLDCAVEVGQIF